MYGGGVTSLQRDMGLLSVLSLLSIIWGFLIILKKNVLDGDFHLLLLTMFEIRLLKFENIFLMQICLFFHDLLPLDSKGVISAS